MQCQVPDTTAALQALSLRTVGPLIIESLWARKWVSTGALEALDDPLVVQMKIWTTDWVPVDNT